VRAALARAPWFTMLTPLDPRAADVTAIERVHTLTYIERAEAACAAGQPFLDTRDVAISRESVSVARLAAGAPLALADAIVTGRIENGFALVRPPGHHAERTQAMGFCLFNNVAILARHLQAVHGVDKIAIIDFDVHHGNGTQHCFEDDASVLYVSTHQYPFYPGTGAASETGSGRGRGATVNCPLPAGAGDREMTAAFQQRVLPALDAYAPEFVIVSAGFDAHRDDPLAELELSTTCYGWITDRLLEVADQHAGGRLVSVLEGGYDLQRLAECATLHVGRLAGVAPQPQHA
jgi:acetoin utilization deacetylase AcuC-like enzyme